MKKYSTKHHESSRMISDEWLTPPYILKPLGRFDLDPCSPVSRPWPTADYHYTAHDNGLIKEWFGRVWLNPPYGKIMYFWMDKLAAHGNGIALIKVRTDTKGFQNYIFPHVWSMLFIAGRISFFNVDGTLTPNTYATAPNVLCAYGKNNVDALATCGLKGKHVLVNYTPVIVVGISPTWKSVVSIAINGLNGSGQLQEIYDLVERIAPDKVEKNQYYKEKIRQTLQVHFSRIKKGHYTTTTTQLCG